MTQNAVTTGTGRAAPRLASAPAGVPAQAMTAGAATAGGAPAAFRRRAQ